MAAISASITITIMTSSRLNPDGARRPWARGGGGVGPVGTVT
jgi:hypothetical protein